MAVREKTESPIMDKGRLRRQLAEADVKPGRASVPAITAAELRQSIAERLRRLGMDPDNTVYEQRYEGE